MSAAAIPTLAICPGDDLVPVATAFERITGQRPHGTTVVRWSKRGTGGIILPTLMVSGRRMTTMEAAYAWIEATTQARNAR